MYFRNQPTGKLLSRGVHAVVTSSASHALQKRKNISYLRTTRWRGFERQFEKRGKKDP